MLHAVVERVSTRLLERLPPDRTYTLPALGQAGLPGPIAHFIAQTLQRRLEAEVQALADARTAWFEHGHADVQAAHERYVEALSEHAQVPAEEWERTLRQAVEGVVPFLVQPARTLGAFVFPEGRDVLPAAVVLRRMRYFNAYPYLGEVVAAYVQRKKLADVDRATFVPLLHRIEHRTPGEYDPEGWLTLLKPLYYALGEGTPPRVGADLLARFFSDKGMRAVAEKLEQTDAPLDANALRTLLEHATAPEPAPEAAPQPDPTPHQAAPVPPAPAPPPAAAPSPAPAPPPDTASASGAVPLWQRYQQSGGRPSTPAAPPAARPGPTVVQQPPPTRPAPPVSRPGPHDKAAPLWQRFRGGDRPEPGAEPDTLDTLEHAVLGKRARQQRPQFVRALFSGSPEAYRALLEKLRDAPSWAEASRLIAEAFRQHHVNIYQEAAVAFTDLAEARFS